MLRYRRYRAFLVFAIFSVIGIYYIYAGNSDWQPPFTTVSDSLVSDPLEDAASLQVPKQSTPGDDLLVEQPKKLETPVEPIIDEYHAPAVKAPEIPIATTLLDVPQAAEPVPVAHKTQPVAIAQTEAVYKPQITPIFGSIEVDPELLPPADKGVEEQGQGRFEGPELIRASSIHWQSSQEHFPVTSTIKLPTAKPSKIPRIQYDFEPETTAEKEDRMKKLQAITDVAWTSWKGYKDYAWMHDEVKPESGGKRDPFCGWAATMVDALDTLWILGMTADFEEAVSAVGNIDFTTTTRKDIPVFETTIRYLGGMLAAYDISGAKYDILLTKSVELAEVLMGAFDTPNRMPVTFYNWMPTFASQPHRANHKVVLAEIGSLSMEFTRLAQLTKEDKYYDAIARITDAFYEWQNRVNSTLLPGLFPPYIDASGCRKPAQVASKSSTKDPMADVGAVGAVNVGPPAIGFNPKKTIPFSGDRHEMSDISSSAGKAVPVSEVPVSGDKHDMSDIGSDPEKAIPVSGDRHEIADKSVNVGTSPKQAAEDSSYGDPYPNRLSSNINGDSETGSVSSYGDASSKAIPVSGDRPKIEGGTASVGEAAKLPAGSTIGQSDKDWEEEPILPGKPGGGKITGWGKPIAEGALDNLGSNAAPKKSDEKSWETEPIQAGKPGGGKIAAWGTPIREGNLDSQENKEKLFEGKVSELTSAKQKRQLSGVLAKVDEASVPADDSVLVEPAIAEPVLSKNPHRPASNYGPGFKMVYEQNKIRNRTTNTEGLDICISQGLTSTSKHGSDKFTLGGLADSTYEYLPKQYILLGGQIDTYRLMYEKAINVASKYLLYRPMTPNDDDILFAGEWRAWTEAGGVLNGSLYHEGAHLTCFVGGMYALGAKLFNRPNDLELAAKLTEGCVWAYASTATGIMPEGFTLAPCESTETCSWDESRYHHLLDPNEASRTKIYSAVPATKTKAATFETKVFTGKDFYKDLALGGPTQGGFDEAPKEVLDGGYDKAPKEVLDGGYDKASKEAPDGAYDKAPADRPAYVNKRAEDIAPFGKVDTVSSPISKPTHAPPPPPLPHKEYVEARIRDERLPPGFTKISSRKYILRPEAIESVWYMYRITGDPHWRSVGWDMWTAVSKHTKAAYGNSAIEDVTKTSPELADQEESFWIAETLKYFYLLFSDENVVNLDEWVLNTEAHPFRRPDATPS